MVTLIILGTTVYTLHRAQKVDDGCVSDWVAGTGIVGILHSFRFGFRRSIDSGMSCSDVCKVGHLCSSRGVQLWSMLRSGMVDWATVDPNYERGLVRTTNIHGYAGSINNRNGLMGSHRRIRSYVTSIRFCTRCLFKRKFRNRGN